MFYDAVRYHLHYDALRHKCQVLFISVSLEISIRLPRVPPTSSRNLGEALGQQGQEPLHLVDGGLGDRRNLGQDYIEGVFGVGIFDQNRGDARFTQ